MNVFTNCRSRVYQAFLLGLMMTAVLASCQQDPPKSAGTSKPKDLTAGGGTPQPGLPANPTGENPGGGNTPAQPGGGGNPQAINYVPETEFGLHLSYPYHSGGNNFTYYCPGDSFISGFKSDYNHESKDRINRFHCQFLQDGRGLPIRKTACTFHNKDAVFGKDQSFQCPDKKVMAGVISKFDAGTNDRVNEYQCCEMRNVEDKKIIPDDTKCSNAVSSELRDYRDDNNKSYAAFVNDEVNTLGGELDFSCKSAGILGEDLQTGSFTMTPVTNAILTKVSSRHIAPQNDRYFSYTCCSLKPE